MKYKGIASDFLHELEDSRALASKMFRTVKCDDCKTIRAILEERTRMRACIEKVQSAVNGWRYAC